MVGHRVETYAKRMKGKRFSAMLVRKLLVLSSFTPTFFFSSFLSFFFQPSHSPALLFENGCNERGRSITLERSYLYLMKSASSSSSNFLDPLLRFQKCVKFEEVGFETVEFKYVKKRRKFRKLENSKYVNKFEWNYE